ncbi:MAG: glycosyltransferase family 2 protein, partial [Sulfolobaceae archaeon]
ILSLIYMNFVVLLNLTAMFMEIVRAPKVWIKTERSGKITSEV